MKLLHYIQATINYYRARLEANLKNYEDGQRYYVIMLDSGRLCVADHDKHQQIYKRILKNIDAHKSNVNNHTDFSNKSKKKKALHLTYKHLEEISYYYTSYKGIKTTKPEMPKPLRKEKLREYRLLYHHRKTKYIK